MIIVILPYTQTLSYVERETELWLHSRRRDKAIAGRKEGLPYIASDEAYIPFTDKGNHNKL